MTLQAELAESVDCNPAPRGAVVQTPAARKRPEQDDHDLERRVVNFLHERHGIAARQLQVEAKSGVVTLSGSVASFYQKQLCVHVCRRVAGVVQLIDATEVVASRI